MRTKKSLWKHVIAIALAVAVITTMSVSVYTPDIAHASGAVTIKSAKYSKKNKRVTIIYQVKSKKPVSLKFKITGAPKAKWLKLGMKPRGIYTLRVYKTLSKPGTVHMDAAGKGFSSKKIQFVK